MPAVTLTTPTEGAKTGEHPGSRQSAASRAGTATPDPDQSEKAESKPQIRLSPINSASSEWAEDIQLNWVKTVCRDDLIAFRDFLKEGMKIAIIEEKVID